MGNKNRNLFRLTRFILLKLPLLFRFFARFRATQKRILIIKTDAIGDYIMFRNFMEVLKLSAEYKDYRIDLLGNTLWKDLAEKYDSPFINEFYFVSVDKLYEAPLKTLQLGWLLFKNNYELVLQPAYTRTFITDGLAALAAAKHTIGFVSDTEGINLRYKNKTDKFYTTQLLLPADIYFEFERTKFFFESVLNSSIELNSTSIPINTITKNGIVIFPGAGNLKRGWEKEKLVSLIILIKQHTQQNIYIAGSSSEIELGEYLAASLPPDSINNLIGKSTLPVVVELIAKSNLVIANESSAIHIAVATKTKSVCILGGGHFGRFAPYPLSFNNAPVFVYEKMECYNCNWICIFKTTPEQSYPCISNVSFEKVWDATLSLLLKNSAQAV